MSLKIPQALIDRHAKAFWASLSRQWDTIYKAMTIGTDGDRQRCLQLLHYFAGPLTEFIDFEFTVSEINRIVFDDAKGLIELYISPRLLKANIPVMDALYNARPGSQTNQTSNDSPLTNTPIPNLQVYKYRSYNVKDPLIALVEYEEDKYQYTDFGCQYFNGIDPETNKPLLNLVIFVRKAAANLLTKKDVTFINHDTKLETKLAKWLPTKTNVVDVILTNIIGEYNLIHNVGYIEFLPEDDPLIVAGSVFTELADLKPAFVLLEKATGIKTCSICNRKSYQSNISHCSRCKKTLYCCKVCQRVDFPSHKKNCSA